MEKTGVQKLAGMLKILVTITYVCNLIALFLVPSAVLLQETGGLAAHLEGLLHPGEDDIVMAGVMFLPLAWLWVWHWMPASVLTVFLLVSGGCTAVILWQGRRVLDTVLAGDTFTFGNAANMRRAAMCCFLISATALGRTVWGLCFYRSLGPLLTYNALFVPIFLMAGLLCMVMSALFRQAAELKAENDLTI